MIVQCWGHLVLVQLVPESSNFDPRKSNFDKEWGQNLIIPNFGLGGPNYLRSTRPKYILDNLFMDTPLDHIWHNQPNTQIGPNMAK